MATRKGAASAAPTVPIRILPSRSVEIDGATRRAGDEVSVSKADADALIRQGFAERADSRAQRVKRAVRKG
jgi:hypothetical protein